MGFTPSDIGVVNRHNDCAIVHDIQLLIMTLHPRDCSFIPQMTATVARTFFAKGNPYIKMRDELGVLQQLARQIETYLFTHLDNILLYLIFRLTVNRF